MDKHHDKNDGATMSDEQRAERVAEGRNRGGADQRRRRLLQGAAATSAVYTLGARPVLANDVCTSSVLMSGNVSLHDEQTACRLGCSPTAWKRKDARWEGIEYGGQVIAPDTRFAEVFLTSFIGLSTLGGRADQSDQSSMAGQSDLTAQGSNEIDLELWSGLADVLNMDGTATATSNRVASTSGDEGNSNAGDDWGDHWRSKAELLQAASHAVAALLNAVHPEVNGRLYPNNDGYPYRPETIINDFKTAYRNYLMRNDSDYGPGDFLADYDDYQDRYCPLPDFYT